MNIAELWAVAVAALLAGLAVVVTTEQAWLQAVIAVAFAVLGATCAAWAAVVAIRGRRSP